MSKRFVSLVAFASLVVVACSDDPTEAPADAGIDAADAHVDVADTAPPLDANAYLCDCVKWEGPTGDLCPSTPDAGSDASADASGDASADASGDADATSSSDANASDANTSDASTTDASTDASSDASTDASSDASDTGAPLVSFSGKVVWQQKTCALPCGVYPLRICSGGGCTSLQQDFCAKDFIPAKFDCNGTASPQVYVIFDSGASCQVR